MTRRQAGWPFAVRLWPVLTGVVLVSGLVPGLPRGVPVLADTTIAGTVTDRAGRPLQNVRATSLPWIDTSTDAAGRFTLERPTDPPGRNLPWELIRFSLPGFRPVTRLATAVVNPIVMEAVQEPVRALTACSPADERQRRPSGAMRFTVPRGTHVERATDVDFTTLSVGHRGHRLEHGYGPHWSNGLPPAKVWRELVTVEERDIEVPSGEHVAEYRGTRKDGSRYRLIGRFGETISYHQAPPDTAAYFDRILETLCWNR